MLWYRAKTAAGLRQPQNENPPVAATIGRIEPASPIHSAGLHGCAPTRTALVAAGRGARWGSDVGLGADRSRTTAAGGASSTAGRDGAA